MNRPLNNLEITFSSHNFLTVWQKISLAANFSCSFNFRAIHFFSSVFGVLARLEQINKNILRKSSCLSVKIIEKCKLRALKLTKNVITGLQQHNYKEIAQNFIFGMIHSFTKLFICSVSRVKHVYRARKLPRRE